MMIVNLRVTFLWGMIDLFYVFWLVASDLKAQNIPFYSDFIFDIKAAESFGSIYSLPLVYVTHLLILSVIFSGILLLLNNRIGVYISLIQSPFRLLLVMPPTFFFLAKLGNYFPNMNYVFIVLVYLVETLKIWSIVRARAYF